MRSSQEGGGGCGGGGAGVLMIYLGVRTLRASLGSAYTLTAVRPQHSCVLFHFDFRFFCQPHTVVPEWSN